MDKAARFPLEAKGVKNARVELSVLDNQRQRQLSSKSWKQMNALLAEPAAPTPALQALMQRKKNGSAE